MPGAQPATCSENRFERDEDSSANRRPSDSEVPSVEIAIPSEGMRADEAVDRVGAGGLILRVMRTNTTRDGVR